MCGIVDYVGKNNVLPILLDGLRRLEYRGYDSAGLAVKNVDGIFSAKSVGKITELEKKINSIYPAYSKKSLGKADSANQGNILDSRLRGNDIKVQQF